MPYASLRDARGEREASYAQRLQDLGRSAGYAYTNYLVLNIDTKTGQ
ncbi:hypothetical protein [Nostoc sp.]|nr:hypothetical protein [Nostoc sp. S13]